MHGISRENLILVVEVITWFEYEHFRGCHGTSPVYGNVCNGLLVETVLEKCYSKYKWFGKLKSPCKCVHLPKRYEM